jgi:hypothetical protein
MSFQERADAALEPLGLRCPAPLLGEELGDYRRRIMRMIARQLPRDYPLRKVEYARCDDAALRAFEPQLFAAAATAARDTRAMRPGIKVDPFIDILVDAVTIRETAEVRERELKAMLDKVEQARKAVATLKAIAPHLIIHGSKLAAEFDNHFEEWNFAIDITKSMATATLESLHLKQTRDDGYRLRAALRYLVGATYMKLSDPNIAKLATAVFADPNDPHMTISNERVRKARRELTEA